MAVRPDRLWDQYEGKARAEAMRGSGWWPLQPHPCALEPPLDEFDRTKVSHWDCIVNGWEGSFQGGLLQQIFSPSRAVIDRRRPIVLPEIPFQSPGDLVPIIVEQFPDDSSSIPKADQLLRSLPRLTRPAAFEIIGIGPQARYDHELAARFIKGGEGHRLSEAITGWRTPYTVCQFVVDRQDVPRVERLLLAHYPNSAVAVSQISDSDRDIVAAGICRGEGYGATLSLSGPYCCALRTFGYLDPDPLGVAIAAMEDLDKDEWAAVQIVFERAEYSWAETLEAAIQNPYRDEFFFNDITRKDLAEKFCGPLFAASIRIGTSRKDVFKQLQGWAEQFTSENQRLVFNESEWDDEGCVPEHEFNCLSQDLECCWTHRPGLILNSNELASLVHLPSQAVVSDRLRKVVRRTRPVAESADGDGSILLGQNSHRGKVRNARISPALRPRHAYIAGASGTGKSTLLLNMILQDIEAGRGVGVLDPHGDLVNDVLRRVPSERAKDVILFDPADDQFPIAMNILEARDAAEKERIVAETLMALERYFPSAWGPRLERILSFTLYSVLEAIPGATLRDVERMLIDFDFRDEIAQRCQTPRFREFWEVEMPLLPRNSVDPVLNKISVFLLNSTIRNIVCQRRSAIDFDRVLNDRQIFLANLSTGILTEKIAGTLGSFVVTKVVNAAFRRARIPEESRVPWNLFVDEFQSFMNLSVGFERILAEARKYGLVLTMANQYVGQLAPAVRQAIFGNVGVMVTFRLGVDDAHTLAKEMGAFTTEEILSLEVGEAIARAGGSGTAFNLTTFRAPPPLPDDEDCTARIIELTRRRFARPRATVEAEFTNQQRPSSSRPGEAKKPPSRRGQSRPAADMEPRDPNEDDLVL